MAETDAGKPVNQFSQSVLTKIQYNSFIINSAAEAAGISPFDIAAPIAREMNKEASGDYNPMGIPGLGTTLHTFASDVAQYGTPFPGLGDVFSGPLTNDGLR